MSYSGPPGAQNPSHHSLPPRPPPSKPSGFKPAFSSAPKSGYATTSAAPLSYSSGPSYGAPPSIPSYGAPPTTAVYGAGPQPPTVSGAARPYDQPAYNNYNYPQQPAYSQPQPAPPVQAASYYSAPAANNYSAPPQIRNPFPLPGQQQQNGADFDPEMAAQIAQWQSAYMPKDPADPSTKTARAAPSTATSTAQTGASSDAADHGASTAAEEKKKTVIREGGGKKWQDDSLLEWDPAHLRLFVGNLAGETTDESLLKAFSRWKSVQKAKVVRDKRTTKSKGFGFVSFSDPDDFFQAAKEMNG